MAPTKDIVMIIIDKDGKVFLTMDDESVKENMVNTLNNTKSLGLNVTAFKKALFFGAPFNSMASFLALPEDQRKGNILPGIPVKDSSSNELTAWMTLVRDSYQGKKPNLLVKGDNLAKYPAFKSVITAFKKNGFQKFQMVTSPEGVPTGSDLWKKQQTGEKREE